LSPPSFETPAPATAETPAPPADQAPPPSEPANEPPPRYSQPQPEEEPSTPTEPDNLDELFSDAPDTGDSAAGAPDASEQQQPPSERPPAETAPAPAAEEPDSPAETDEEPAATPDFEDLFPPTGALTEPGGWASDATRTWTDARGRVLLSARMKGVTAKHVLLTSGKGAVEAVSYEALSDSDLRFLRRQIEARRAQLSTSTGDKLLAKRAR
jgi:hypothetical protein